MPGSHVKKGMAVALATTLLVSNIGAVSADAISGSKLSKTDILNEVIDNNSWSSLLAHNENEVSTSTKGSQTSGGGDNTEEPGESGTDNSQVEISQSCDVKVGADISTVNIIAETLLNTYNINNDTNMTLLSIDVKPTNFDDTGDKIIKYTTSDGSIFTVTCHMVEPVYSNIVLPAILASSEYNTSASVLQRYIAEQAAANLKVANDNYTNAFGTYVNPVISGISIPSSSFLKYGDKTYEFDAVVNGKYPVKVSLKVNPVIAIAPSVSFDTDARTWKLNQEVLEYSTSKSSTSFKKIHNGEKVPASLYGDTIYVRTPATNYSSASDVIEVNVPTQYSKPDTRPVLESTSYSIEVINSGEYSGEEYSLDGERWQSSNYFDDLEGSRSYTVYVRYPGGSNTFSSDSVSSSIKTKEAPKNDMKYSIKEDGNTSYIAVNGTLAYDVSNNTLSASYNTSNFSDVIKKITEANHRGKAVTTFNILLEQEESDIRDFNKIRFSFPKSVIEDLGNYRMCIDTPILKVTFENDGIYQLNIDEITSSSNSTLKDLIKSSDDVYKITTAGADSSIKVSYRWNSSKIKNLDCLDVIYMDKKYKNEKKLKYKFNGDYVEITIPGDGYIAVSEKSNSSRYTPFIDTKNSWATSYIEYVYHNGLMTGTSQYTFKPDAKLTKSMLIVMLAREAGYNPASYTKSYFSDVPADSWYSAAVAWGVENGVLDYVHGAPNQKFNDSVISRADTAEMIVRANHYDGEIWEIANYTDRGSIPAYAIEAVDELYNRGVMVGDENNRFKPSSDLTRAEIATIIYRLHNT